MLLPTFAILFGYGQRVMSLQGQFDRSGTADVVSNRNPALHHDRRLLPTD